MGKSTVLCALVVGRTASGTESGVDVGFGAGAIGRSIQHEQTI